MLVFEKHRIHMTAFEKPFSPKTHARTHAQNISFARANHLNVPFCWLIGSFFSHKKIIFFLCISFPIGRLGAISVLKILKREKGSDYRNKKLLIIYKLIQFYHD